MSPWIRIALKRALRRTDFAAVRHRLARFILAGAPAMSIALAVGLPFTVTEAAERETVGAAVTALPAPTVPEATGSTNALAFGEPTVARASFEVHGDVVVEPPEPPPPPVPDQPPPAPDPCADALAWVAEAGLPLPPGVGYHCPSTQFAHHGAACWSAAPCRGRPFIAINLDLIGERTTDYVRHVVAHEVCHILDFQAKGWTTEADADACAAAHGA